MSIPSIISVKKGIDWAISVLPNPPKNTTQKELCNKVFANAAAALCKVLSSSQDEKLANCRALAESVETFEKHPQYIYSSYSDCLHVLIHLIYQKAFCTDTTQTLTTYFTITDNLQDAMSLDLFTSSLDTQLQTFADLANKDVNVLPKGNFEPFKKAVFKHLIESGKPELALSLDQAFFTVTQKRWLLKAQAICELQKEDKNSLRAAELIENEISLPPSENDFNILCSLRDLLFVEKQLYSYLVKRLFIEMVITQKVIKWIKRGAELSYTPNGAINLDIKEEGILELGLILQAKKVCAKLIRGESSLLRPFLQNLVAYEAQEEAKPCVVSLCRSLLLINELLYKNNQLVKEFERLHPPACALVYGDSATLYPHKNYLVKKRFNYLFDIASMLFEWEAKPTTLKALSLREYATITHLRVLATHQDFFTSKQDSRDYEVVTATISRGIAVSQGRREKTRQYQTLYFETAHGAQFGWDKIDFQVFSETIKDVDHFLTTGLKVESRRLFKKLKTLGPDTKDDKGYGFVLPKIAPRRIAPQKAPRPQTPPSVPTSRGSSPIADAVEELAKSVEVLQVVEPTPPSAPKSMPVFVRAIVPPKPLAPSPQYQYATRVSDWWAPGGSPDDPFVKIEKYRNGNFSARTKLWIRVEHAFALAVDSCLGEATGTKKQAILSQFNAKRRLQLIGQIEMDGEVRVGVFTFTIDKAGVIWHRWFTQKGRNEILNPGLEGALDSLPEVQDDKAPATKAGPMKSDSSKITSITSNLVTISDPKFGATIKIFRSRLK